MQHIVIIGGGNMGGAIARQLCGSTRFSISLIEQDVERREAFFQIGLKAYASLGEAPKGDIYLLAIKPQQFAGFVEELRTAVGDRNPLLISILAGTQLAALQNISSQAVRAMPNLAALVGESMSVLCAPGIHISAKENANALFASIGKVAWVDDEEQLHAITAISGSGPGYVFAFMEALELAATSLGLSPELAHLLVSQTVQGSAQLAAQSTNAFSELRAQVTSKGGTTEAGLQVFKQGEFKELVGRAAVAARSRSKELASH